MKKQDLNQFKNKSISEIAKKIKDLDKEKTQTQIELKMGKHKNVHILKKFKKDIAQLKTISQLKYLVEKIKTGKEEVNAS